jgi:hypothetical protein
VQDWDSVSYEYVIDPIRPDIVLLRNKTVLAAIEIYMWHMVDKRKKEIFVELNIPWIEVNASKNIYEGKDKWRIYQPLPHIGIHPEEKWKCDKCSLLIESLTLTSDQPKHSYRQSNSHNVGECVFCKKRTDDWWYYDCKTNSCKCYECYKNGIY